MFRCSSNSILSGVNATFTIKLHTQPGENVYLCGNTPELGEWNVYKAKKMSWNCGNTWDVDVGFEHDARLQYKYFVQVDETKTIRWESITNRDVHVEGDGVVFEDKWDSIYPAIQSQ